MVINIEKILMLSIFTALWNLIKSLIKYIVKGAILYFATFLFPVVGTFMPIPIFKTALQIGVMGGTLYLLDIVFKNLLPFIEGFGCGYGDNEEDYYT